MRAPAYLMLSLVCMACETPQKQHDPAVIREALLEADRAFARETAARGLDGWMAYYADDAVRLVLAGAFAESTIVQGKAAIRGFDADLFADSSTLLSWQPTDAGVFADGRSGFTTGRSVFLKRAGATIDTLSKGRYVTIWRQERDGDWRVALDTGAQDPRPAP